MKKLLNYLKLFFVHIFIFLGFLLDNTIGYLFTRELKKYNQNYQTRHQLWERVRKGLIIIIILILIFSFEVIYIATLGPVFAFIFKYIAKFFSLSIFGNVFTNFSNILLEYSGQYANGIGTTLYLSLIGTTVGLIIAIFFSYILIVPILDNNTSFIKGLKKFGKKIVRLYVTIIRGTPMMVQAMLIYWGTISFIPWDYKVAGLVVVSINTTAYLTEVLRGGFESVDKGQREGALSLGLSEFQTMLYVTFPQALKNSMAAIGNEFVINIKDTAVLSVILVVDIFRIAELAAGRTFDYFTPFIIAALIYLFLTLVVGKILKTLEKRLDLPESSLPSSN